MNIIDIGSFGGLLPRLRPYAEKVMSFDPFGSSAIEGDRIVHKCCLFDRTEERTFYVLSKQDASSLFKPNYDWIQRHYGFLPKQYRINKMVSVPCVRLDEILFEDHDYGGMKIDAQGAELRILKSAGKCLNRFSFLDIESYMVPFYQGGSQYSEVAEYLRSRGFHAVCKIRKKNKIMNDWVYVREGVPLDFLIKNKKYGRHLSKRMLKTWNRQNRQLRTKYV